MREGLAITGYSLCNCLGSTTAEVIEALAESRTGLRPPARDLPFETVCGTVRDDLPGLPSRFAAWDSRQARIALQTLDGVRPALDAAIKRWGAGRLGIVLATSTGGIAASEDAYDEFRRCGRLPEGYDYRRQHTFHAFVELLQSVTGVRGPAYVVSTACSSSAKVLASARRLIAAGVVDAVLAGGVDSLARTTLCGFAGLGVLSSEPCRPFAADRRGMNIGEGGAMLMVERDSEGPVRLLGVGETSDAHHMSSPHPEGLGAVMAMEAALREAGVEPGAVDHVNAHGTGTVSNDAAEAAAIARLFGTEVPVTSTKGFTGHMLGAAGATEAVFAMVAIENGWIPANVGTREVDPAIRININRRRAERRCRVVMSNSFGFGGSNAAVVFGAA